jgi:hypothetical protein
MTERDIFKYVIQKQPNVQEDKIIEECAEVIHAIQKLKEARRTGEGTPEAEYHLIEELTDLEILLDQMKIRFPAPQERAYFRQFKIHRLAEWLGLN